MGRIGKGKAPLATQLPEAQAAYIVERAKRLEWTVSKTTARIIELWTENGAPPLSSPEEKIEPINYAEFVQRYAEAKLREAAKRAAGKSPKSSR